MQKKKTSRNENEYSLLKPPGLRRNEWDGCWLGKGFKSLSITTKTARIKKVVTYAVKIPDHNVIKRFSTFKNLICDTLSIDVGRIESISVRQPKSPIALWTSKWIHVSNEFQYRAVFSQPHQREGYRPVCNVSTQY